MYNTFGLIQYDCQKTNYLWKKSICNYQIVPLFLSNPGGKIFIKVLLHKFAQELERREELDKYCIFPSYLKQDSNPTRLRMCVPST